MCVIVTHHESYFHLPQARHAEWLWTVSVTRSDTPAILSFRSKTEAVQARNVMSKGPVYKQERVLEGDSNYVQCKKTIHGALMDVVNYGMGNGPDITCG
jgi:hypothetical protein